MNQAPLDLGDDPGRMTVRVAGQEITVDVYLELDALNTDGQGKNGYGFLQAIRDSIKSRHGVEVSAAMAHAYYKAIAKREGEVAGFFSNTLASRGLSDSTPEGSPQASGGDTSPR